MTKRTHVAQAHLVEGIPSPKPLPLKGLAPIEFGPKVCQNLSEAASKEWWIANGVGGFAASTILGMNTRRSHGLLVAASNPPLGRLVTLSKVEETLVLPNARFDLATNQYSGVFHPEGFKYLVHFRLDPWPSFFYRVEKILLEKSVFLLPGENAVVVGYTLHEAPGPVQLAVRPLVAMRDLRGLVEENDSLHSEIEVRTDQLVVHPYSNLPPLMIHHTAELLEEAPCWHHNFEYFQDGKEGPPPAFGSFRKTDAKAREDLWSPGQLLFLLRPNESCSLVASLGRRGTGDLVFHQRRLENTQTVLGQNMKPPAPGPSAARLTWASDAFVASRSHESDSERQETFLLSGFPWGGLTTREALIGLPGLTLSTRRFDLARSVLETLGGQVQGGLLPARCSEEDGVVEYDSADTSLWFFWAAWHFWKATGERRFFSKKLLNIFQEIMEGYLDGTEFGIAMDEDGLLELNEEELALTWMEAREPSGRGEIAGPAVTPRFGKPVEVNALWYCALMVMATLCEEFGSKRAATYKRLAKLVQKQFTKQFLSPEGFLYDRLTPAGPDPAIRPNALIAAGLPFSPLTKTQAAGVLSVIQKHLLTSVGIRSLSPEDPQYKGKLPARPKARAQALHQGAVWTWLLGSYADTLIRVQGANATTRKKLGQQLKQFEGALNEGTLGCVPELFEGNPPHAPGAGGLAAAATGELLRTLQRARLDRLSSG